MTWIIDKDSRKHVNQKSNIDNQKFLELAGVPGHYMRTKQ